MSGPLPFIPAPAQNPLARRCGRSFLPDSGYDFFFRRDVFQVQPQQALAQLEHVRVRIDEPWQDRGAMQIDGAYRWKELLPFPVASYPSDALAGDGDRLRRGLSRVHGYDVGV